MKKSIIGLLLTAGLIFFAGAGFCAAPVEEDTPPSVQQMQKVRERIESLRMWKLIRALDLNESLSARLFPVLNSYDKKRQELEISLRDGMKELKEALKSGRDDKLSGIIEKLEQNHKALQKLKDEEIAELKKILTVQQQAKYIIFNHEFQREIRDMIEESKGKRLQKFVPGQNKMGPPEMNKQGMPFAPQRP